MCFSNLPVEFDENGDPYLADDADDVTRPGDDYIDAGEESERAPDADTTIDVAPEEAYDAILATVPETARSHLSTSDIDTNAADRRGRDAAEGD